MRYQPERIIHPEWLESPTATMEQLQPGMAYIRRINRFWGGTTAILNPIKSWSRHWPETAKLSAANNTTANQKPITFIDLGTGSADIPLAIVKWARANDFLVRVVAVDRNPNILDIARQHIGREPWIDLIAADVLNLPFPQGSFDYALSSLLLHHLPDIEVLTVLRVMENLSLRGMVWSDLHRSKLAYHAVQLGTLFSGPVIRHDAVASVQAAFSRNDVRVLQDKLGLHHLKYRSYWPLRFTLAGEHRPQPLSIK